MQYNRNLRANYKKGDSLFALLLVLPALATTFIFILFPVIDSVFKSFVDFKAKNIINNIPGVWNNFANYKYIFSGSRLSSSIIITFVYMLSLVFLQFVLGMGFALILNRKMKAARFLRSIMMIPWVVPTVISALVWLWIYQPQYGLLKYIFSVFGVEDFAILNNPDTALIGIIVASLWKQIPLTTLLLLAGLQNVPHDIIEASEVDGTNSVQKFFFIVMPYMKSVIKIVISMAIIENFKQFPLVWTMTNGGPQNATTTLAVYSYQQAFVARNIGRGAAITTIWMLLMMLVVFIYNKLMGKSNVD